MAIVFKQQTQDEVISNEYVLSKSIIHTSTVQRTAASLEIKMASAQQARSS